MKIFITGKNGQVGRALVSELKEFNLVAFGRSELDLINYNNISKILNDVKPDLIINAAAYTDVDGAEDNYELAKKINCESVRALAEIAYKQKIPMIHYSTDYVFNGNKKKPYDEEDATLPINKYGLSKLDGENALKKTLKEHVILRTSWVYDHQGKNFLNTILDFGMKKESLSIVSDQIGTPTSANFLANKTHEIINLIKNNNFEWGTYNLTLRGEVSWYGFAKKIIQIGADVGYSFKVSQDSIYPIKTIAYKTKAKRPLNSKLSLSKIEGALGYNFETWDKELVKVIGLLSKWSN